MAQGDGALYNEFKEELFLGNINLYGHTLKMILVTGYTPNIDSHNGYSDVSASEESGTGYTSGGSTLGNKGVTKDTTNDRAKFDADDVTWTGLNVGTPSHAILYDDSHASKCLVAYWEVTTPTNGGNYTLQFGANGIILLT
ncbi:hypothetical protein [Thauera sp.]|uniref:hypothetical protein n=1 Tax=Thauera sp. TaxID=1905334 RepID=UPI002CEABFC8|nr:hypothetical protein [Thauera sp.]HRP25947.1 hypothetical protein [Thauera sp.]